jgi:endonuclease/exonuclease/phosphatase family metal-dependent hydrolase
MKMKIYCQNIWNNNPCAPRNCIVRELVRDFDADVCFFQECGPQTNRIGDGEAPIVKLMNDSYSEVYPEAADRNFTPVFYKNDKYNLIDSGYFLYDGLNDANSKSVTWAVLEEKETGKKVVVASTHLWWKYDSEEDNFQRLQNVAQLKRFCDEMVSETGLPIIVGGDFNNGKGSLQGDEPYHIMLKEGFCDTRLIAEETCDEPTCVNSYPDVLPDKTVTPRNPSEYTIDYIFTYNAENSKTKKFNVLTSETARQTSDHSPVLAIVEI